MYVKKKRDRLCWVFLDAPVARRSTIRFDLEYEVIDRVFVAMVKHRSCPRDRWSKARAASTDELSFLKSRLLPKELAACMAASINPAF